jgi:RNA polymerase sigma-70 factor (ECF subfamily)
MPPAAAAAADEAAFTDFYHEHREGVTRYMLRRGAGEHGADLAAEAFAIAWRRRAQWLSLPMDRQVAWLYTVARNVLANARRAERRATGLADRITLADHHRGTVADHGDLSIEQMAIAVAFDQLSESDQEVLRLVIWDGLSPAQAGQVLGCRASALATRLHRARTRLRKLTDARPERNGSAS